MGVPAPILRIPIAGALPGSPAAVRRVSGSLLQVNKLIPALAFLKESLQHFFSFLLVLMSHTLQEM